MVEPPKGRNPLTGLNLVQRGMRQKTIRLEQTRSRNPLTGLNLVQPASLAAFSCLNRLVVAIPLRG